jgi:hypothetical protein
VEVCEGTTPTHESDMGIPHTDAILTMRGTRRDNLITMERSSHISRRNAKVRNSAEARRKPGIIIFRDYH